MDRLSTEARSKLMSKVRSKDTKPEMIVRTTLHGLGYRYQLHLRGLPGTPDIVFSKKRKILFVNGCFWHGHFCKYGEAHSKSNVEFWNNKIATNCRRDKKNINILRKNGWKVMTVWECRVKKKSWLLQTLRFLER